MIAIQSDPKLRYITYVHKKMIKKFKVVTRSRKRTLDKFCEVTGNTMKS